MLTRAVGTTLPSEPSYVRRCAGLLLAVAGIGVLAFVSLNLLRDGSLWLMGQRTEAQVVGAWIEQATNQRTGAPAFRWHVRYQFTGPGGRVVTGTSGVSHQELSALNLQEPLELTHQEETATLQDRAAALEDGPRVDVLYFPAYPDHNRLDDSRFVPLLACAYVPLLLVGSAALTVGRRLLRIL